MVNLAVNQSPLVREKPPLAFSLAEDLKPKPKIQAKMMDLPSWPTIEADDRSVPESQSSQGATNLGVPDGEWTNALQVQIEETAGALRDLIKTVNYAGKPIKDGKVSHGCFEGLSTNCWMASKWDGKRTKYYLEKQHKRAGDSQSTAWAHGRKAEYVFRYLSSCES